MFRSVIFCVIFVFGVSFCAPKEKCEIPISGVTSFFPPLCFKQDGTLVAVSKTKPDHLEIDSGEVVVLSCKPNFFKNHEKLSTMTATCVKDQEFNINGTNMKYEDLSCDLRSIEEVMKPVRGCSNPHRGVKFGYTNPINGNSYVIGESCYATEQGRTIYVHSRLRNGNNVNITSLALKVEDENYFRGPYPSNHYRIEFLKSINAIEQAKTLNRLLGSGHNLQLEVSHYLDNDYLAHPQFQTVKKFAWNSLLINYNGEKTNLDVLKKDILGLGVFNLDIYTGNHGTLSLKNRQNIKVNIYLRGNKYPVPKYIWTVVKNDDKATAFILINDPKMTDDEIREASFCESKCDKITWISNLLDNEQYKKKEDGYILCCDLRDFKTKVPELPDLDDVVGMFK